ncbi:hypothetical protein J7382_01925 [Shimia sp. R11_0]|uniref:Flagellar FliJ protein n=1 Tax=Shimia marina TaxID=321267 RepID=A0A0P1EM92_9RHOB|nr:MULTISPECIES: hypothetical protein [Shimia]MBO9476282.1 hypothetical protein [Shimia sp. R11_0]CUH51357.1 hypothetical protein SHM7688_00793 [Shimia marina]SFD51160.1 hypothetical protein SAMN04488037_101314 [Shimia marina]
MTQDLKDLNVITQARYQKAQAEMQAIQAEENKLRGLLSDLADQEKSSRDTMQTDATLRLTGGDLAWNNWIGRNRKILNQQLANVLVRKEMAFQELQKHFGKADVMEKLLKEAELTRLQTRRTQQVTSILETKLSFG